MQRITVAKTAGFCFGVNRAVDLVYRLSDEQKKVRTLGPIIHNPQVVDDLKQRGVMILSGPEEAHPGDTVVIRSHGVPGKVYEQLREMKVDYVDATCPFVAKIHQIVAEKSKEGYTVIIAGDRNHPEVLGILGHCSGECYVIQNEKELISLLNTVKNKAILIAQTTFHTTFWENCVKSAKKTMYKYRFF